MGFFSALFGLGGCKDKKQISSKSQTEGVYATAQLNHLIMPLQRGERYEDPLDEALRKQEYGSTDEGGTMQLQSGEIAFIDVEIILTNLDEGVPFVIKQLESFGAPKGSVLRVHDSEPPREITFGKAEGIAIYLDGVNLPKEVYESSDVNVLIEELNKRLEGHGEIQGHWQGPTETALYFYGNDAEEMKRLIRDFTDQYPLCQNSRIITIAPKPIEQ